MKFQARYESENPVNFIVEASDLNAATFRFGNMLRGIGIENIDRDRIKIGEIIESGFFGIQRLPF
jgi:hypothetical protein